MAIELKQTVKMSQQLLITPQLQQAIKLLQMSRAELVETVQKELMENPVLEESEDSGVTMEGSSRLSDLKTASSPDASEPSLDPMNTQKDFDWANYIESAQRFGREARSLKSNLEEAPNYENFVANTSSLADHLEWQVTMRELLPDEEAVCHEIIGNIDDNGYLIMTLEEMSQKTSFSFDQLEDALCIIQDLDPKGVGARNLEECLMLQVKDMGRDVPLLQTIIKNHLDIIQKRNYPLLARKLDVSPRKAHELADIIVALDPKPGRAYAPNDTQYITPDIYVIKSGSEYVVSVNDDGMPRLQISHLYRSAILKQKSEENIDVEIAGMDKEAKNYINEKLKNALWLIKSIHQRQKTLYKVTKAIVDFQKDFFDKGVQYLKPLILRDVADEIGMHESTVSRATNGKYVHTPQGIFELKYFFNAGVSQNNGQEDVANEVVKEMIRQLVAKEDIKKPLSDQALVALLKRQNINVARRTVAKYRELIGILPSSRRRKLF